MALKHVSLCFVLLFSVQVCLAGPTTTPASIFSSLDDYMAKAKALVNDASAQVTQLLGLPEVKNVDQVLAVLRNASDDLYKKVNNVVQNAQKEFNPDAKTAKEALQKFYEEVNKTAEDLKKKIPELQVGELRKVFDKSLQSLIEEGNKLKNAVASEAPEARERFFKIVHNITESVVKAASTLAEQVQNNVDPKKHTDHSSHHKA